MKKITYLSALALGLALVACDDYKEPNPPAQSNPPVSVLQPDDITVSDAVVADQTYSLEELNDSGETITLATVSVKNLSYGYSLGAEAYISANNFSTQYPLTASVVETEEAGVYDIVVTPDDLQGVYVDHISKGPKAKTIGLRYVLTTISGDDSASQVAYIGGPGNYYTTSITVLPFPSQLVIEEAYYLVGTIDDWSVAGAVKLNHSGLDPYDDPVFTIKFDVPADVAEAGWWWKIIPQSTYEAGDWVDADYSQFGVAENGDTAESGILVARKDGVDPGAGCFKESGPWLLTINMEESTYEFSSALEQLYTPGAANGWSQTASQLLTTTDYAVYTGYAVLSNEGFKFSTQPNWDGTNYGAAAEPGELSNDGGAGNLTVDVTGLYWCEVNVPSLKYSVTLINTIGVIGDATPGGWDASTALTQGEDYLTWTGDITFGEGEWKFRANDGWDVNLGGALENLTQNGGNLPSPGVGTYQVTLNLSQIPYSCTVVKK